MAVDNQFVVDPALTAIVRQYKNPAWTLIAQDVLPEVPVMGMTFKYQSYPIGDGFTVPDTRVGSRSAPNRVELQGESVTGQCLTYGLDIPLDNDTVKEAERQGYNPKTLAAQRCEGLVQLDREQRTAAFAQDTNNYAADNIETLAGTAQFSDFDESDPLGVLSEMLDRPLVRPNQIVMGQVVWGKIRLHPQLVSARNGNSGTKGMITKEELADILEVKRVLVGHSRINTARPGKAVALERVWGNFIAGHYTDSGMTSPEEEFSWGFAARYGKKVAGTIAANIGLTGGELVRSGEYIGEHLMSAESGFLIQTPIAAA